MCSVDVVSCIIIIIIIIEVVYWKNKILINKTFELLHMHIIMFDVHLSSFGDD